MFSLIYYTHTDYMDIWKLLFMQTEIYFPSTKKYLFVNSTNDIDIFKLFSPSWTIVTYDDKLSYQNRVSSCLNRIDDDVVIFHHEDMMLYSAPNYDEMNNLVHLLKATKEIDFIKLIRAEYQTSIDFKAVSYHPCLYKNPIELSFAIQPTICKKEKLFEVYSKTGGQNIWQFETEASKTVYLKKMGSFMYFNGSENKRGMFHWDSLIYPYFATAVVKGKWNFTDYSSILKPLLKASKTDISIRGAA